MKKWEYKVETVYADGSAIDINALGEQGWELCTIVNFRIIDFMNLVGSHLAGLLGIVEEIKKILHITKINLWRD